MTAQPWGLYVHVPWCRIRCPYCAFHVDVHRDVDWDGYVARVHERVAAHRPRFEGPPRSVYLGGGTPSLAPPDALHALLSPLRTDATSEVTVEANPEDVDDAWVRAAHTAGVTRVSLGVQTLDEVGARRLGRAHTPAHAHRAAERLRSGPFHTWSADLMFGLDRQDLDACRRDLDAVLAMEPPHVSLYGLTIEPGTAYERGVASGRLLPADDEVWRAQYALIVQRLGDAGLERYEVSNFARPGHRSLHNAGYWEGRPYMGVGPSAHGYAPDGRRWVERADTAAWLQGSGLLADVEHPTPREAAVDRVIAGMRGVDGIDLNELVGSYGWQPSDAACRRLVAAGLLELEGRRMRLAAEGFFVADGVVSALVDALEPLDPTPPVE